MLTIFKKTIREKYRLIVIMALVMVPTMWMYVSLFPTFNKQADEFEKLLASFPKEMWQIFGLRDSGFSIATFEQFISVELFSLLWPIIAIILFINLGNHMIGREIDKGTITMLLALPIDRVKIFAGKYFAGLVLLVGYCIFTVLAIFPLAGIYGIRLNYDVYWKVMIIGGLFLTSGYGIAILISTLVDSGKSVGLAAGIYLIMYILNVVSSLNRDLENLKYISLFHYLDFTKVLYENQLTPISIIVMLSLSIVCPVIAVVLFKKKDITV